MGRLLEFILFAVVAYFVFKFLNNLFSRSSSNTYNKPNSFRSSEQKKQSSSKSSSNKDINWDAETIDYEEVEPNKDNEKK